MKNETKLERLKKYLDEQGLAYRVPNKSGWKHHSDLVLDRYRIYVKISRGDEGDRSFYDRHHTHNAFPVFIRDDESPKFIFEKVTNTIVKSLIRMQSAYEKSEAKKNRKEKALKSNRFHKKAGVQKSSVRGFSQYGDVSRRRTIQPK